MDTTANDAGTTGNTTGNDHDHDDSFTAATMSESMDTQLTHPRAERFYDRIRHAIENAVSREGKFDKVKDFLLFAPDVFILLWRLANDNRVAGKDKVLLGSGLAYYIFPLDVVPELLVGPVGFLDDLVFGVYILNRLVADTDEAVLREHWSGSEDLLHMMKRVLDAADNLVTTDFVKQIKKMMK